MSDYVIKGQTSEEDGRIVVIDETDWSVEVDESPIPNFICANGNYFVEVINSKKLVFLRKSDGEIISYGNVDPIEFWDEKTDDSYWTDNGSTVTLSWTGSAWEGTNSSGDFAYASIRTPLSDGQWNDGYRPQFAKVEYTLSGGGSSQLLYFVGCCGRNTTSQTDNTIDDDYISGTGIDMSKLWFGRDDIKSLNVRVPDGETVTITGIYFSKDHFNDYVCDGYGYTQDAIDNATALTTNSGTQTGDVEIFGIRDLCDNSGQAYIYMAVSFSASSEVNIKVESSGPSTAPGVSIYSDRDTKIVNRQYSGDKVVSFNWTPSGGGTYYLLIDNQSQFIGTDCDMFSITVTETGGGEPPAECTGYADMDTAVANTVSGTKATEQTWKVSEESQLAISYGENLGTDVDVNATSTNAFIVSFLEQSQGDLVEDRTSDFYWGVSTEDSCQGTQVGSGAGTTWDSESWDCTGANTGNDQLKLVIQEGTDGGSWGSASWRPDILRVYFTGPANLTSVYLRDDTTTYIDLGTWNNVTSGQDLTIDWTGGGEGSSGAIIDMLACFMDSNTSFTVTKIEFVTIEGGDMEWSASSTVNSSANGPDQEVVTTFTPSNNEDWLILLENEQLSCIDIDMTVTHSGAETSANWLDYTSDFYWGATTYGSYNHSTDSWDTTQDGTDHNIVLDPDQGSNLGAWATGFIPEQIRITYTGGNFDDQGGEGSTTYEYVWMNMYDTTDQVYGPLEDEVAWDVLDQNWKGGDIQELTFSSDETKGGVATNISKIEFWEHDPGADGWNERTGPWYWGSVSNGGDWNRYQGLDAEAGHWYSTNALGDSRVYLDASSGNSTNDWFLQVFPANIRVTFEDATTVDVRLEQTNGPDNEWFSVSSGDSLPVDNWNAGSYISRILITTPGSSTDFKVFEIEIENGDPPPCGYDTEAEALTNASSGKNFGGGIYGLHNVDASKYAATEYSYDSSINGWNIQFECNNFTEPTDFLVATFNSSGVNEDSGMVTGGAGSVYLDVPDDPSGWYVMIYNIGGTGCDEISVLAYGAE